MALTIQPFDPITMLGVVNNTPRPKTAMIELFMGGDRETFPTELVMIDLRKGQRRMAPFTGTTGRAKLVAREGFQSQMLIPPTVRPADVITPSRIAQRQAGESIVSGITPAQRLQMEQVQVMNSFDAYITRREEWMVAQLLTTGSIPIIGDDVNELYAPGFAGVTVLTNGYWSDPNHDIVADIRTWAYGIAQDCGIMPDTLVMSTTVPQYLEQNELFQKAVSKLYLNTITLAPKNLPNGALWYGRLNELGIEFYVYPEWYVEDYTGTVLPMIPNDQIVLGPSKPKNAGAKLLYGAWTEMKTGETFEGTRVPRWYVDEGNNIGVIEYVARPLPTMTDVTTWMTAIVTA